jgi:hypothetical protein
MQHSMYPVPLLHLTPRNLLGTSQLRKARMYAQNVTCIVPTGLRNAFRVCARDVYRYV